MSVSKIAGVSVSNQQKNNSVSFGRAFTTAEQREWEHAMKTAREQGGIKDTYMICFDSSLPSQKGKNTGIGTSFSEYGQAFIEFMQKKTGITFIQHGPQGTITKGNLSPFSGTVFAVGDHLIDLEKLTKPEYSSILDKNTYKHTAGEKNTTKVQYDSLLGADGKQKNALYEAFENFKTLDKKSELKVEYNKFLKSQKSDWLERDSLYEALSEKHGNDYWKNWNDDLDKNLFTGKYSKKEVENRKKELVSEYSDTIEFNKFIQFIADKQQKETKQNLAQIGVKEAGDCLIGFAPKERWAFANAFKPDHYVGCSDNGQIRTWGIDAIDYSKLGTVHNLGESGKLLKQKFDTFFEKYDGARIDAAWQLVKPFIYEQKDGQNAQMRDVGHMGDRIFKILEQSAKEHNVDTANITYEMLGGPVDFRDGLMRGRTQIEHSIYQNDGWGSVKFYKDNGMQDFTFGLGTHDDKGLIEIAREKRHEQAPVLSRNLKIFDANNLKNNPLEFMRAKWAEIFTNKFNFFTAFDAMGMDIRFNDQGINPDNWTARVPDNFEEVYHQNLTKKLALNTPKALADSRRINGNNDSLTHKLYKMAEILEQKGPMTQAEADKQLGKDFKAF